MSAPPTKLRRALRWFAIGAAVLATPVLLGLLLVASILFIEPVSRLVLQRGLDFYNERIPGEIEVGSFEGRLGGTFALGNVTVSDSTGRPLLLAGELVVDWSPWPLVRRIVDVERLTLRDGMVRLPRAEEGGGWGDLAAPTETPPPKKTLGPDLPVHVRAALTVRDLDVVQGAGLGRTVMVGDAVLDGRLDAVGTRADLAVEHLAATFPGQDLVLDESRFVLQWDEPRVTLAQLSAETNAGTLAVEVAQIDVTEWKGRIDARAVVAQEFASKRLQRSVPGPLALRISGQGRPEELQVNLWADVENALHLDAGLRGHVRPDLDLRLGLDLQGDPQAISGRGPSTLDLDGAVTVQGESIDEWHATAVIDGTDLGDGTPAKLTAEVRYLASEKPVRLQAEVDGDVVGVELEARAALVDGQLESGRWNVRTRRGLGPPLELARTIVDLPQVSGTLSTSGTCTSPEDALRCEATVNVDRFAGFGVEVDELRAHGEATPYEKPLPFVAEATARGVSAGGQRLRRVELQVRGDATRFHVDVEANRTGSERAVLAVVVSPRDPLHIDLQRLFVHMRGVDLRLVKPASITASKEAVVIDGLDVTTGQGRLAVDGRVGLKTSSDLEFSIEDFDLTQITRLVPAADLDGTVAAKGWLRGVPSAPSFLVNLQARRLRAMDAQWGSIDLDASYDEQRLGARLVVDGVVVHDAVAEADVPLELDFERGRVGLRPARAIKVRLDVRQVRLDRVAALFEGVPLTGTASIHASLEGTPKTPRIFTHVAVDDVIFGGATVGDANVKLNVDDGLLDLEARVESPLAKRVSVDLTAPVDVSLVGPKYYALGDRDHAKLDLEIEEFRIADLGKLLDVDASGTVDVVAHARLEGDDLQADAEVRAARLEYGGKRIGFARLQAAYGQSMARADLEVRGPIASAIVVHAEVPVELGLRRARWLSDRPHVVRANISNLDLARLEGLVPVPVTGRLSADAVVQGLPSQPVAELAVAVTNLAHRESTIGNFSVQASYGDGRAQMEAMLAQTAGRWSRADVDVPIDVDLSIPQVRWRAEREHRVDLRLSRLRETLLRPWFDFPSDVTMVASVIVHGEGTLEAFDLKGDVGGRLIHREFGAVPFDAHLVADAKQQSASVRFGPNPAVDLDARVEVKVPVPDLIRGRFDASKVAVRGRLDMKPSELETLAAFIPKAMYDPKGTIRASARADGTLTDPNLRGQVSLHDAEMTVVPLRQRLTDVQMRLRLDQRTVRLQELSLRSGKGRMSVAGAVALKPEGIRAQARLKAKDFPLTRPGFPFIQIDAKVSGAVEVTEKMVDAEVVIANGRVDVIKTNIPAPEQIPDSDAIEYVDLAGRLNKERRKGVDDPGEETAGETPSSRALELKVIVKDPVVIVGGNMDMRWGGKISVVQEDGQRVVRGAISADQGMFELLGHQFDIQEGRVTLPSEEDQIDPYLHVVATTDTPEALVTVRVHGRVSEPELSLTSDPALSDSEIFTLLVTGSTNSTDSGQENVQTEAASLLTMFSNPQLRQELKTSVGIDRAGVSFGENINQPILSVGKRVTRDVYVETEYHHNAPEDENDAEVRVEYRFRPRWAVETYFGNAAEGGVNLYWRLFFGSPRRRERQSSPERPESGRDEQRKSDGTGKNAAATSDAGGSR